MPAAEANAATTLLGFAAVGVPVPMAELLVGIRFMIRRDCAGSGIGGEYTSCVERDDVYSE